MKFTAYRGVACVLLAIAVMGCSSDAPGKPLKATGVVTLDGMPLPNATVGFTAITQGIPIDYRYKSAKTNPDGSFVVENIYPAEYMVTLSQDTGPAPADGAMVSAVSGNTSLAQYANDSPLRAKVSPETTTFKFEAVSAR